MKIVDPLHEPKLPPVLVEFTGVEAMDLAAWWRMADGVLKLEGCHPGVVAAYKLAKLLSERH